MNKVMLIGRLTADPEIRYSQGENATAMANYTLAVDRRYKKDGERTADFIRCVVFGKAAEFSGKYFSKGMKVAIVGRIQTGSYINKDGQKVYTTDDVCGRTGICRGQKDEWVRNAERRAAEFSKWTEYRPCAGWFYEHSR